MSDSGQSFTQKLIDLSFTLASGNFAESGTNTVDLSGLRVSAHVVKSGEIRDTAEISVRGMTLSLMNQLSTLGMQVQVVPKNTVTMVAGDTGSGMSTAFIGTIYSAFADFSAMPDNAFRLSAQTVLYQAVSPAKPSSTAGSADVATLMEGFANQLGMAFENNGVNIKLSNPYFYGSIFAQASACAKAAGIGWTIDSKASTLAIWPKNGSRNTTGIPLISPTTGMKGFPSYTAQGIEVTTLWNPAISVGGKVQIQSSLPVTSGQAVNQIGQSQLPANGIWAVFKQEDHLESMNPNGEWFTTIGAYNPSFSKPLVQ